MIPDGHFCENPTSDCLYKTMWWFHHYVSVSPRRCPGPAQHYHRTIHVMTLCIRLWSWIMWFSHWHILESWHMSVSFREIMIKSSSIHPPPFLTMSQKGFLRLPKHIWCLYFSEIICAQTPRGLGHALVSGKLFTTHLRYTTALWERKEDQTNIRLKFISTNSGAHLWVFMV